MLNLKKESITMIKTRNATIFALAVFFMLGLIVRPGLGWHDGCTPGFWKNHTEAWPIEPTSKLTDYFTEVPTLLQGDSLIKALKYPGGSGYLGAARILLRTAVAAMLNIQHPDVEYRGWDFGFKDFEDLRIAVDGALFYGDREQILSLAEELDGYNNWNCPLGD
jgi:hypothetical protein